MHNKGTKLESYWRLTSHALKTNMSLSDLNNVNGKSLIILIWRKSILIKAEFLLLSTRQTWHAHRYWSRPALASGTHPPEPLHTFLSRTEIPSTQSFALSTPAETWFQFQGGLPVAKNKREWMMLIKNCPMLSLKQ